MILLQSLPESARSALAAAGIDVAELSRKLALGEDSAILLVGSHASGTASPTSDLDFLVLTEDEGGYAGPAAGSALRMSIGLVQRHLVLIGSQEVDIEVVRAGQIAARTATLGRLGVIASRPADALSDFQVLENIELRLLERVRNGLPLSGHERVRHWRETLHLEKLPLYATLAGYLGAMACLEDAVSMSDADPSALGAAIAARSAAEEFAESALAYRGHVLIDLRLAEKFTAEWKESGDPYPLILSDLRNVLFPDVSADAGEYLSHVHRCAADLFEFFRHDGRYPGLAEGIRWFGRDRWRLDVTFLGGVRSPGPDPAGGSEEAAGRGPVPS